MQSQLSRLQPSVVNGLIRSPAIAFVHLRQQRTSQATTATHSRRFSEWIPEVQSKNKLMKSQDGTEIPWIGLGTAMHYKATPEDLGTALTTAVDEGYRYFDSASMYESEAAVGTILKRLVVSGKVNREDLFILSKLPPPAMRPKDVEPFLRKTLEKLQLDYVDMYLVHTPMGVINCGYDVFLPKDHEGRLLMDRNIDHVAIWKKMEEMVDKGLTKAIGLSNFNIRQIQRVLDNARIKPANLQVECNAYLQQTELHDFCRRNGMTFSAFAPLGSPAYTSFLTNKGVYFPVLIDDPALKVIAERRKKTVAQVLLRWLFERGIIAVPKSSNPIHIQQNIDIFDFELSEDDTNVIVSLDRNLRLFKLDFAKGMTEDAEYPF